VGDSVADDDVDVGHGAPQRAGGPGGPGDGRRRAPALDDVRRQQAPDGHHAQQTGADLVELRLLPIADEQGDRVPARAQLKGGVDDEPLGAPDAQPWPHEGDLERSVPCHRVFGAE
jgi:hypothetical protein